MGLTVESRFDPVHTDMAVVTLAGEVDVATAGRLRDHLAALLARGARHLVLDFSGVAFIDSSGLSVLAGIHRLLCTPDQDGDGRPPGTLALAAVNLRIREVLRTTGFTRFLPIYSTVEPAVAVHDTTSRQARS
ncbi:STAS domain-containing protein [Actinomadura verrucosospora]|uniref:Anti-sigma factor antagonist n=1 Tax=Actinomadura verrucosospora TaxID=46165 RepID=A0A7D3ZPQ5_ACTVE|nr:STAS domain-containing protein [Actinomadura verrucosospora]QKG23522.1 anti-sigma-factor antagonist domain-containing protein [Actinomadura verrucosospora]